MLTGFDHLTLATPALEPAAERLRALLGRGPFFTGGHPELGTESALFALENTALELVAPARIDPEGLAEGLRRWAEGGGGLQALAFATAEADALSSALRERGLRATRPQAGSARSTDGAVTRDYRTVELSPQATRGLSVLAVERPEPLLAGRELTPDPSCPHALDHVVLRSADLDAACALYGEQLGIRLALDKKLGETRMLFFRIGGVTLEVVHDAGAGEHDVLWGAAYRVRSIEAAHARLLAGGFALGPIRDGRKPGTRVFSVQGGVCNVPTLILEDASRA
jgi:catechol 2,3-dioxygenase-like lactoylglutathione lyase family enzyme